MNGVENIKEIFSDFIQSRRKYTPLAISLRRNEKTAFLWFFCHFVLNLKAYFLSSKTFIQLELKLAFKLRPKFGLNLSKHHRRNDLFLGASNFLPVLYILGWLEKMNDFSTLEKVNLNTLPILSFFFVAIFTLALCVGRFSNISSSCIHLNIQ